MKNRNIRSWRGSLKKMEVDSPSVKWLGVEGLCSKLFVHMVWFFSVWLDWCMVEHNGIVLNALSSIFSVV